MSKPGQNNQKGIIAQNWAAMSLFLQFLRDSNFSYIRLEPGDSEDFDLVFKNGKRIICESKFRKEKFSHPHLKELLTIICQRKSINDQDEILVVCRGANSKLISETKNVRFFPKELKEKFKKHGFDDKSISLLPKVNFWIVPEELNAEINSSLLAELLNMWLPAEDLKRFEDNLLQKRFSALSQCGGTYSRDNFENDVSNLKKEVKERGDYFNDKVTEKEEQFRKLEKEINNNTGIKLGTGSISAFSVQWDLMAFAMDRLKTRNDLDLKKLGDWWQLNRVDYFTFGIFHVFENNLQSKENREFVLHYIKKYSKDIRGFYHSDYFRADVVKLVTKIIEGEDGSQYIKDAFGIVKDLITSNKMEFFYLKDTGHAHGEWEKEEICKLLHKVYARADAELKKKILNLVTSGFNIIEDSGEFSFYAPKEIFEILQEWLNEDFTGRLSELVKVIADQCDRFYKQFSKKIEFEGWEHMGGVTSYWGNDYQASDRHFIEFILAPAIRKFYDQNNDKGWDFIIDQCITKEKSVSKARPDFLNRSVYEIVLDRYASNDKNTSKEAYGILKEFILSRRGIPSKSELIYQSVARRDMSIEKKWKLVELVTKKYKTPVNPFVEKIVANLSKRGYQEAKNEMRKWFNTPEYFHRWFRSDTDLVSSISTQLDTDLDLAIDLFKGFLGSVHLKSKNNDHFETYHVAYLLHDIIKKDYNEGLALLRSLEAEDKLNEDQQIIYSFSLADYHGNDESDDPALLKNIYRDVVDPFLSSLGNDINKIIGRLPSEQCRGAFVKFSERLAVKKCISEALRIIRVFVDDPDPYLPGSDPGDPEDKYNEHKKIAGGEEPIAITSVRGECGWALMKCAVLDGRNQLNEIIELTDKLVQDENYYVVHMACYALNQLAGNRLKVLPSDRNTLFFNDSKEEALRMARYVEKLAFDLLDRFLSWPAPAQKAMTKSVLRVFDPIRALNESDALRLVKALTKLSSKGVNEAAGLLIYYAEFRKNDFKNWKFSAPGLYDDLGPEKYDSAKFKKILIEVIKDLQQESGDSTFNFAAICEHIIRDMPGNGQKLKMVLEYFDLLTNVYNHNVFNLIYDIIAKRIESKQEPFTVWYNLYLKCLRVEKEYYDKNFVPGKTTEMYWWPYFKNSEILELIYKKGGKEKFIEAAEIIFSFPKGLELHEKDNIISILKGFPKSDKRVRRIFNKLLEKNPSKYWDLKIL